MAWVICNCCYMLLGLVDFDFVYDTCTVSLVYAFTVLNLVALTFIWLCPHVEHCSICSLHATLLFGGTWDCIHFSHWCTHLYIIVCLFHCLVHVTLACLGALLLSLILSWFVPVARVSHVHLLIWVVRFLVALLILFATCSWLCTFTCVHILHSLVYISYIHLCTYLTFIGYIITVVARQCTQAWTAATRYSLGTSSL